MKLAYLHASYTNLVCKICSSMPKKDPIPTEAIFSCCLKMSFEICMSFGFVCGRLCSFEICISFWVCLWKVGAVLKFAWSFGFICGRLCSFKICISFLGLSVADCAVFEICIEFWVLSVEDCEVLKFA